MRYLAQNIFLLKTANLRSLQRIFFNFLLGILLAILSVFYSKNFDLKAKEAVAIEVIEPQLANDLKKVEEYLNQIRNFSADFLQESSDGSSVIKGKFYLARGQESAGKMRIEYLSKPKILIVVNGAILSYVDVELDEVSRLSTNTTPASFLTRPNISFSAKDIEITSVDKKSNLINIALRKKNRREAGEFHLTFRLDPVEFVKMEVLNDLDQLVSVKLLNIDSSSKISNNLFVIKSQE